MSLMPRLLISPKKRRFIKFLNKKKKKKVDVIVVHIGLKWLVPSTAF